MAEVVANPNLPSFTEATLATNRLAFTKKLARVGFTA